MLDHPAHSLTDDRGIAAKSGAEAVSFDLTVKGGTVVAPRGRLATDLGVSRGRIVAVGDLQASGTVIDASGLLVFPGMVDTHVHLMDPGPTGRISHGTRAAAAGVSPPSSSTPMPARCALRSISPRKSNI